MVRLFLDDIRMPKEAIGCNLKMNQYYLNDYWCIVRSYSQFVNFIERNGLPDLISFDHDLADGHYHKNMQHGSIDYDSDDFNNNTYKTGYHCAKYLVDYCLDNKLRIPKYFIHSMNPVGRQNIESLLKSAIKNINK